MSKDVFSSQVTSRRCQCSYIPSLYRSCAAISGKRVIVTMPPRPSVLHNTEPDELDAVHKQFKSPSTTHSRNRCRCGPWQGDGYFKGSSVQRRDLVAAPYNTMVSQRTLPTNTATATIGYANRCWFCNQWMMKDRFNGAQDSLPRQSQVFSSENMASISKMLVPAPARRIAGSSQPMFLSLPTIHEEDRRRVPEEYDDPGATKIDSTPWRRKTIRRRKRYFNACSNANKEMLRRLEDTLTTMSPTEPRTGRKESRDDTNVVQESQIATSEETGYRDTSALKIDNTTAKGTFMNKQWEDNDKATAFEKKERQYASRRIKNIRYGDYEWIAYTM